MGCDIHLYTEKLVQYSDTKPTWVNCDRWEMSEYWQVAGPQEDETQYQLDSIYHDRNYSLFSVLANVRNYGDNPVMSEPRGLPKDVSAVVQEESDQWGRDGHSHSYFTLAELKAFQKKHPNTQHAGLVSPADAAALDSGTGTPSSWCQGTSDKTRVPRAWTVEGSPLDNLIEVLDAKMRKEFWIFIKETDTAEYENNIRIVFWFDN